MIDLKIQQFQLDKLGLLVIVTTECGSVNALMLAINSHFVRNAKDCASRQLQVKKKESLKHLLEPCQPILGQTENTCRKISKSVFQR